MRDISLHLLDIIENSIRADATVISVTLAAEEPGGLFTLRVEDNGRGFTAEMDKLLDPFHTTKDGKKTGLGLSLLQSAAERAAGGIRLGRSELGGAMVEAWMVWSHLDRSPLGDLPATFSSIACTNSEIDLRVAMSSAGGRCEISTRQLAAELPGAGAMAVAKELAARLRSCIQRLWPGEA